MGDDRETRRLQKEIEFLTSALGRANGYLIDHGLPVQGVRTVHDEDLDGPFADVSEVRCEQCGSFVFEPVQMMTIPRGVRVSSDTEWPAKASWMRYRCVNCGTYAESHRDERGYQFTGAPTPSQVFDEVKREIATAFGQDPDTIDDAVVDRVFQLAREEMG